MRFVFTFLLYLRIANNLFAIGRQFMARRCLILAGAVNNERAAGGDIWIHQEQ